LLAADVTVEPIVKAARGEHGDAPEPFFVFDENERMTPSTKRPAVS